MEPHDQNILDLIDALNISPIETSLSDIANGQIILVKGQIVIRDYEAAMRIASNIIPAITAFNQNLGKQNRKVQEKEANLFVKTLKFIPTGLELEVLTSNNEILIGAIKPECLTQRPDDLLRIYGNRIPGEWYILGIIDDLSTRKPFLPSTDFRNSIDEYAEIIRTMYSQDKEKYAISPVLIYRDLVY